MREDNMFERIQRWQGKIETKIQELHRNFSISLTKVLNPELSKNENLVWDALMIIAFAWLAVDVFFVGPDASIVGCIIVILATILWR